MKFDSNKITNEHIYWNQASLLAQICLLEAQICLLEAQICLLDLESLPVYDIEQTRKILEISSQQKRNENPS